MKNLKMNFFILNLIICLFILQTSYVFAQVVEDTTPPQLVDLDFTPKMIDTGIGDQVVTFTLRVTDDISGFDTWGGELYIRSLSSSQHHKIYFSSGNLISGDANDGIYEFSITFSQYSGVGIWVIDWITLRDVVKNHITFQTTELISLGFPVELEVVGESDITPPQLVELDFTPKTIDTFIGDQVVTFTLRITDDLSGLDTWGGELYIRTLSGSQHHKIYFSSGNLISGDANDGIYEFSITFPQYSEVGIWVIDWIYLRDVVKNHKTFQTMELISLGFPVELEVVGESDITPPQLVDLDFTPKTIDTGIGDQVVTFTLRVTDDISGLDTWGGELYIRTLSGSQHHKIYFSSGNLISGDANDGIYEFSITFPQYSEMGIWVIDWIYLRDVVKNHITFQTTELISLGFPVELEVTDNQPPVADAGKDITVEATSTSGAQIILDGSASSDPDGDMMIYTWRESGNVIAGPTIQPKSTVVLALGTHTIELTVDDGNGETDTDEVIWNVVDTTPPELSVSLDPDVLWPPNHKMVNITASVEVSDLCDEDAAFVLTSISSSEPDDTPGNGDGNTVNDIQEVDIGTSDTQFQLRAERMGNGDGRFYSVEYTVSDASGNSKKVIETVNVPHDKKGLEKEMISSISEIVPETLCLNQNYPNPFNPITFIQYGIPEATQVKLEVYNTLGQRIRTLIDHHQEAGVYSVEWNGRDDRGELTSSGIYFYLLRAGDKLISNKMMKVE